MQTRNYCYGARAPVEGLDLFWRETRGQLKYRNQLVELERTRRAEYATARRTHCPEIEALELQEASLMEALDVAVAELKQANQRARRNAATNQQKQAVTAIKAQLRECRQRLKEVRKTAQQNPELLSASDAITLTFSARQKVLRANCGIYWGNYLTVEDAAKSFGKGPPPCFARWTGDGKIAVQLQGGMSPAEAFACTDPRLRIERVAPDALPDDAPRPDPSSKRSQRRQFYRVWIRIGSKGKGGREPIWCKVPVMFHRPLPENCSIKWCFLHARKVGTHVKWTVRFAITAPDGTFDKAWQITPAQGFVPVPQCQHSGSVTVPESGEGNTPAQGSDTCASSTPVVGIDVGWRKLDDGLRVAYWHGSDGQSGQLVLPLRDVGRWDKADSLRAIRDRMFDTIREQLRAWLATPDCPAPDWLRERLANLHAWRSCARLASTLLGWWQRVEGQQDGVRVEGWRNRRFPGDEEIYAIVEAWRKQDKHIYDWECFQRRKAINWRENTYRNFCEDLAKRYQIAVYEDTDWTELARLPAAESDEAVIARARYLQRVASPGRLLEIVKETFCRSFRVPAEYTTQQCHACGHTEAFDAAVEVETQCPSCGLVYDQDHRAAINLLECGQNLASTEVVNEIPGGSREPEVVQ